MRHVGRIDPETKLPITEVTQAEFDALPSEPTLLGPGEAMRQRHPGRVNCHVLTYRLARDRVMFRHRRLVIVEDATPRHGYINPAMVTEHAEESIYGCPVTDEDLGELFGSPPSA